MSTLQTGNHESGKANRKIGVLGGMFDPVHEGHLQAARAVLSALGLDEVRLMPCSRPVHRDQATASDEDRLAMLVLAAEGDSRLVVDDRECRRSEPSWTCDSLEAIHSEYPDAQLFLLMGADTFATLEIWHRWQHLFSLCHIVLVGRPGTDAPLSETLKTLLQERQTDSVQKLHRTPAGLIYTGTDSHTVLSSTGIRNRLARGESLIGLVPESVSRYINGHGLYH